MWFADFMMHVPAWARLLLAVALTAGSSLTAVVLLRSRILELNAEPERGPATASDERTSGERASGERASGERTGEGAHEPGGPDERAAGAGHDVKSGDDAGRQYGVGKLAGDAARIVGTAFVFLLAFSLGQFWGNVTDARSAVEAEQSAYTRAVAILSTYPETPERARLRAALDAYALGVREQEAPLLRRGNSEQTYREHARTSADVSSAALAAEVAGYGSTPQWAPLSAALTDLASNGTDRIDAAPQPYVPGLVVVIGLLGITNLALTVAFQPARRGPNLFLVGLMSVITALLLFVLLEASNPFLGAIGLRLSNFGG